MLTGAFDRNTRTFAWDTFMRFCRMTSVACSIDRANIPPRVRAECHFATCGTIARKKVVDEIMPWLNAKGAKNLAAIGFCWGQIAAPNHTCVCS
eukprot:6013713-Amphidinium_carterae.1